MASGRNIFFYRKTGLAVRQGDGNPGSTPLCGQFERGEENAITFIRQYRYVRV
jgi:hypothetical protein